MIQTPKNIFIFSVSIKRMKNFFECWHIFLNTLLRTSSQVLAVQHSTKTRLSKWFVLFFGHDPVHEKIWGGVRGTPPRNTIYSLGLKRLRPDEKWSVYLHVCCQIQGLYRSINCQANDMQMRFKWDKKRLKGWMTQYVCMHAMAHELELCTSITTGWMKRWTFYDNGEQYWTQDKTKWKTYRISACRAKEYLNV